MSVTITNVNESDERTCENCGSTFVGGNAKRQYCSDSCRTANHRKTQKQTILQQEEIMQKQNDTINALKDAPTRRTESVKVINPEWDLAQRVHNSQVQRCSKLEKQLEDIQKKAEKMTSGKLGAWSGAILFMFPVLVCVLQCVEDRKQNSVKASFLVVTFFFLIAASIFGFIVGRQINRFAIGLSSSVNAVLAEMSSQSNQLKEQLSIEQRRLEQLQNNMDQVRHYETQTITSVDEVSIPQHSVV